MRTIKFIIITGIVCGLTACNDSFMQQIPETAITVEGFFKSTADLQTYVNGFYNDANLYQRGWWVDDQSDNVTIWTEDNDMYRWLLNDQRTPENAGGWDNWGSLRSVNVMLANLDRVEGNEADINHYAGIARYFRAWFYINKVQAYSDVPWIDRPLSTTDALLYETQTPRAEVVQHILEDLDYAVTWIKTDMNDKTRIHQYCALALLSRFALYEGTYRKYHPELNLASTASELLQKSVAASEALMNSDVFDITGAGTTDLSGETVPGVTGAEGFRNLFVVLDLSPNKEIINWRRSDVDRTAGYVLNPADRLMANSRNFYSLSRSLQESFLTKEGKPYSTVAGYT
ncbi:MAG: RagB/SusD family nutrient uptake outer membrane protein, partial [Tannerella sp.]|nr:RagB/SusD family nutrient uptake outer membrane protein [Tannerella sp.]